MPLRGRRKRAAKPPSKAARERKSLNEVNNNALVKEAGGTAADRPVHHDLDHLAGTWVDDPAFDAAVAAQDEDDPDPWR